jgi:hypothetical protein
MVQWEVNTIGTARGPLRQNNNVGMLLIFITMREPGGGETKKICRLTKISQ